MSMKFRKTVICFALVFILGLINISPAFASDTYNTGTWYSIGTFSFTDYTISSVKKIMGRYLVMDVDFYKPYWDSGIGDIYLTIEIRDHGTGQAITGQYVLGPAGGSIVGQTYYAIDLGYAGRQVEFWFDASSAGSSNGNFRSATVEYFGLYTYN